MELDDLKKAWQEMERRLEKSEALNLQAVTETRLDKVRSAIRRFGLAQTIELALWLAMVIIVAPFWIEHRGTPHFLISGLVLHAYGVAAICVGTVQLLMIGRIRYSEPVLVIQKRVAELRYVQSRSALILGLAWWCLWVPSAIVAAKVLGDFDIYAPGWVIASLATGVVGIVLTLWGGASMTSRAARRHVTHPSVSNALDRFADRFAGCSLTQAQSRLDEIERFAHE